MLFISLAFYECFSLDPKTVCVEKSEVYQAEQLDKLGMEVIPVDMRDAYAFGGGLHCCTAVSYTHLTLPTKA